MSTPNPSNAISAGKLTRALIYAVLIAFACFYLLPLYVMLVNSLKPLDEIRQGGMLNLPQTWTIEPWLSAWSTAQIGVEPTGLRPYFINSVTMVVPAVIISTILGALNGYVLTKWQFPGHRIVFGMLLLACFIPFQIVLIPMARVLGMLNLAGTTWGLVLVHVIYGLGFTTLYFRNYYEAFPTELIRAAQIDGATGWQVTRYITLPLMTPILFFQLILAIIRSFQQFSLPILLAGGALGSMPPRSTYLFMIHVNRQIFVSQRFGYGIALLFIMFLLILILTGLLFWSTRYWVYQDN